VQEPSFFVNSFFHRFSRMCENLDLNRGIFDVAVEKASLHKYTLLANGAVPLLRALVQRERLVGFHFFFLGLALAPSPSLLSAY